MDDRTFDQKTATEWISTIEVVQSSRDADIYPRLNAWIRSLSPINILDLGCGQGICSDKIDLRGCNYTGLDPSPYLIKRAQQNYPESNRCFQLGNAYDIPFSDETFDAIFSVSVWHLLADLTKAAMELSRALKTGGRFLIITANPDGYPVWTSLYTSSKIDGRRFEGSMTLKDMSVAYDVLHLHGLDEIVGSFKAANLEVERMETFRRSGEKKDQDMYIEIRGRKMSNAK